MENTKQIVQSADRALKWTLVANFALLTATLSLFAYWNTVRSEGFALVVFIVQALPLALLLPSLIKKVYRAYSWLCFVTLIYFIFAVQRVFLSNSQVSDYIFLTMTVCLFLTSMMASRWLQRQQKGLLGANTRSPKSDQ